MRDGGVTVVKAVESAYPLLRVFVHVKSGGWEREVSDSTVNYVISGALELPTGLRHAHRLW